MPLKNDADLFAIWLALRRYWFPHRQDLDDYHVTWSRRTQKHTLASCQITKRHVFVANELNWPPLWLWLEPLLYHELCHAVLGLEIKKTNQGHRAWHGKDFKILESRHPLIPLMNDWVKRGKWHQAVRAARIRNQKKHLEKIGCIM